MMVFQQRKYFVCLEVSYHLSVHVAQDAQVLKAPSVLNASQTSHLRLP